VLPFCLSETVGIETRLWSSGGANFRIKAMTIMQTDSRGDRVPFNDRIENLMRVALAKLISAAGKLLKPLE